MIVNKNGKRIISPERKSMIRLQKYSPNRVSKFMSKQLTTNNLCLKTFRSVEHFAKTYKINSKTIKGCENVSEKECWKQFPSINDFFIRQRVNLPPTSRSAAYNSYLISSYKKATGITKPAPSIRRRVIVSPADNYCICLQSTSVSNKLWIKGKNFTIQKLFSRTDIIPDNYYLSIFRLAPHHYHRFHCPVSGKILSMYYIGSEYYSVHPIMVNSSIDVYTDNIRLVLEIQTTLNEILYMAIIGATCVGSIEITHPGILSILKKHKVYANFFKEKIGFKEPPSIELNDELGNFQFGGSTIVLYCPLSYKPTIIGKTVLTNSLSKKETFLQVGDVIMDHPIGVNEH